MTRGTERHQFVVALVVLALVALGGVAVAGASPADAAGGESVLGSDPADATVTDGQLDELTVDADFVGTVADEGAVTVTATGLVDADGETVDGERVVVTVGGEPATTADVTDGALETTFQPATLALEPQADVEVAVYGFGGDAPTVDVVHEVADLDEGYNLHSVPQGADLVTQGVGALNVWDAGTDTYDAVTDPAFETPDELNRALYVAAHGDDARLGYTFETDQAPTPGEESFGDGWNFVGSNFDISSNAAVTLDEDLVGIDAAEYTVFTADFGEELGPEDPIGAYQGYWVFVDDAEGVDRGTVAPTYDRQDREDVLGVGDSHFEITGVETATSETADGGLVEVTATIENQGTELDTQFVDLNADADGTGEFDRVDRTGAELDEGDSEAVTLVYETDEIKEFDITVTTDDHEITQTVAWEEAPFFAVSDFDAPEQVDEGEAVTASATVTNTGSETGTQDVLFNLDAFGNFDEPDVQVVVEQNLTLAPADNASVEVTVDAPAEAGQFEHGIFTDDDSQTATLQVGDNQVEGSLGDETVSADGVGDADTFAVPFTVDSLVEGERDVRAYELDVTFDPGMVGFVDAELAAFPESAELVVNDENADEGHVRVVAITTEETLTPVEAGELLFDPVDVGETDLAIDPAESAIEGPSGEARNPVWSDGSVTVESGGAVAGAGTVGAGASPLVGSSATSGFDSLVQPSASSPVGLTGDADRQSSSADDDEVTLDSTGESVSELTLVTGHTVTVIGEGEDRKFSIEGPDGGDVAYTTAEREAGTFVRPAGVDTDLYSEALFNVDLLLEQGYDDDSVEGTPIIVDFESGDGAFSTMPNDPATDRGFAAFESTTTLELIDAEAGIATGEADFGAVNDLDGVSGVFLDAQHEVELDEAAEAIDAPGAREEFDVDGSGVDIAILDTGIDADHPDFGDRVVDRVDFTGDGLGDRQGHGTHVAGIAAGDGTEGDGQYVGIAPGANLMDVKVLDDAGAGSISGIVDGVEYAIDNDADIVSMSLGGPVQPDDPLVEAVEEAVDAGVTAVVSAGNAGTDLRTISSPGNAEEAITVGATEEPYDEIAFFSSSGPSQLEQHVKPEVVAPGFPITAAGSDDAGEFPYTAKGGTSMSAPAVSGLSALVLEAAGDIDPSEVEDRLVTTADPLSGEFENDIFRQGGGQVNSSAAIDTDIVIHDSVQSIGVIEDPTQETLVYDIENVGEETVTLDGDVLVYNVEGEEQLDNAQLNETTVTVDPGETAAVAVDVDIDEGFGPNSGVLTFEGEGETYRAIFGYSRGLEVTVEKIDNPKNTDDWLEDLEVFATDGTFSEFEIGAFVGTDEYSFVLPAAEEELNFWSISEYEDIEDPDAFSEAAFTVKEGVQIDEDNTHVVLDESQTFPRAIDTSEISDDEPFDVLDYTVFVHANVSEDVDTGFGVGGFGEQAHFTELEEGTLTNISTSYAMVPADEVGSGGPLDSPRVYTVVGATETLFEDDPDFTVDPDTFAEEEMTLHRLENEFYDASTFLSPADQNTFPGSPPFAIREDIGEDRQNITWIRNAEGQYEHVFGAGDKGSYRYVGSVWSPDVGDQRESHVNAGPFVANSDWDIDDRLNLRMTFAAGAGDDLRMAGNGNGPLNHLRVDIDSETVIDEPVGFPGVSIDGPIGPDTDVAVEIEGNSMVNRSVETAAKYEGNSDDPAPPNIESLDILDHDINEPVTDAEITVQVEVDSPGGLEPRLFRAYHAHGAHDRPTEDWRSWDRSPAEHVGDGVFEFDVHVDPGADELDLAFRALDEQGNGMEVATLGATPVDLDLAVHPAEQRAAGAAGGTVR